MDSNLLELLEGSKGFKYAMFGRKETAIVCFLFQFFFMFVYFFLFWNHHDDQRCNPKNTNQYLKLELYNITYPMKLCYLKKMTFEKNKPRLVIVE